MIYVKISTKSRYAIEALLCMVSLRDDVPINIGVVAEKTKIPQGYLEQLFFKLRKSSILETQRGRYGGYFIVPDLDKLTVRDIMQAVDENIIPVACIKDPKQCGSDLYEICPTRNLWNKISNSILEVTQNVTLAQLLEHYKSGVSI